MTIQPGQYIRLSSGGTTFEGSTPSTSTTTQAAGSRFPQSVALGAYVVLTNVGAAFDATNPTNGLGVAVVDFSGATSINFQVRVNKIGTGHQYWQLYNQSALTQIAVIRDAGSAGTKTLATTFTASTASIPAGVALVRVRSMSSVAADDPVYYGGSILIF